MDITTSFQESLTSSCESSLGSEVFGPLPGTTLADLTRVAVALLPVQSSLSLSPSSFATHSLSQSTSSSSHSTSRSQSPSKLYDNKCYICSYKTNRRSNLIRHLETMHRSQDDYSLECCDTMFSSKSDLREHKKQLHSNGYGCLICSRSFCRRALLKRHMNVHSGQKDFNCIFCRYATSHKSNLERHIYRLHGVSAGNSFKATRAIGNKRRIKIEKPGAKRYHSLPSGLDNLGTDDGQPNNAELSMPSPAIIPAAAGKPRLCWTTYKCQTCSLTFKSQIESSVHSLTCEMIKNCAADIIKAADILMQLKHSKRSWTSNP